MHGGNTIEDTAGCPVVGYNRINDKTIQGSDAASDLVDYLRDCDEEIYLNIVNQQKM